MGVCLAAFSILILNTISTADIETDLTPHQHLRHVMNTTSGNPTHTAMHCRGQWKYGQWVRGASVCGLATAYDFELRGNIIVHPPPPNQTFNPFADWCWRPHHCTTIFSSVAAFCQKLGGRKIFPPSGW
ncbi:hypothetical protein EON65_51875 [archaeon]|nr:MAG: hypothetical protein EON65_51875 [archaeon]